MSIYRVITRIIPLNSSETSTFEPATFDQLTDGYTGEVKVLNLVEPQSGMKYRIERIEYKQNAGPGETVESMNQAYAEKLKKIPGFTELKDGETPLNPYDKSFQITLPKVLPEKGPDDSENDKSSTSFKISVVKNFNFKKASPKKKVVSPSKVDSLEKEEVVDKTKLKSPPKSSNDSKVPFKTKYPSYLSKKIKNSVWKKKSKSPQKLKSPKQAKSKNLVNGSSPKCTENDESKASVSCPTSTHVKADQDIDVRKTLDRILDENLDGEKTVENHTEPDAKRKKINLSDDEETDFTDNSLDSEGALIINVIDEADVSDKSCSKDGISDLSNSNEKFRQNSNASEDSFLGDSFDATNSTKSSQVLQNSKTKAKKTDGEKYAIREDHPAHDLLVALQKYFLNGECLICGFIAPDKDFNACDHMESHVLLNSFASSYKCSCCDGKLFPDPRNLYNHSLSQEKTYNYDCNICTLKFKRKYYLFRHTTKCH